MKAKEFAKELLEIKDGKVLHKMYINKCLEMQQEILDTRYKGVINYENYTSAFKDVDVWQKSVVSNLLKLDKENRFKDFSHIWKSVTNESLKEQGMSFRF